jgi:hypothetical protein
VRFRVIQFRRQCDRWLFPQALGDSSVLPCVRDHIRHDFIVKLATEWLADKRLVLLYRGSCHSMTAAAFHGKCDGKGPTLVLIAGQSVGQPVCVFGGYAGKSWERGPDRGEANGIDSCDSFLFTVANPFGDGIVKMTVNEESRYHANNAMMYDAVDGPVFGCGFAVANSSGSPTEVFDESCGCGLMAGGTFGDPLGRGYNTFTGSTFFVPLEIEVWSVF